MLFCHLRRFHVIWESLSVNIAHYYIAELTLLQAYWAAQVQDILSPVLPASSLVEQEV